MVATATVIWNPAPHVAALTAAATPAAADFAAAAASNAPAARVASSIRVAGAGTSFSVGSSDPLGGWFEEGTRPHAIAPRGKALKFPDGGFVGEAVTHPGMRAEPWLKPLLPAWPGLYRRRAASALPGASVAF